MFTGIIRYLGTITHSTGDETERWLTIATKLAPDLTEGDSVAVNGACLTVLETSPAGWRARLMHETIQRTNLGRLAIGDRVNLERPVRAGETLDGHFVLGHIDGLAEVAAVKPMGDDRIFSFTIAAPLVPQIIPKGSVALDGVSLTVVDVQDQSFTVSMMPYTLQHTAFGAVKKGYQANIETDIIGKYAARLIPAKNL